MARYRVKFDRLPEVFVEARDEHEGVWNAYKALPEAVVQEQLRKQVHTHGDLMFVGRITLVP
jgi:hypothetical protein